ncbi:DNA translocase FtsK [Roseivivax sediminis]|uniref:DNA translocase FtsK n=1 Tax=Roseivivax sediminis TaxID=936889 RepID=A0A1I1U6M6_9RHOB|nr:DNA translocase FtsK [Roseivivax sediminis]SFD66305.1 DNA translocase FtsK [Roseivivax sediminis]
MAYQARGRDPLFDTDMANALERRGKELLGLALIAVGLMAAAAFASYTPDDPSWMSATDAPVRNWMGAAGAAVAAPLFMIFGAGNWVLPVVLIAWGLRFVTHSGEERAVGRLIFTPIWWALAAVYAAGLNAGPDWNHSFGLGGLFGDVAMGSVMGLLPLGPALSLKVATVGCGAAVLLVGAFVIGFTRRELTNAARMGLVGLVMSYATVVRMAGRGAGGAVRGAQAMQDAHAERRARRQQEAEEAAAWAAAQAPQRVRRSEPMFEDDGDDDAVFEEEEASRPRGGFLARLPALLGRLSHGEAAEAEPAAQPQRRAPLVARRDAPAAEPAPQPEPERGGLLGRMPSLIRRGEPMPEPELVDTDVQQDEDDGIGAPTEDRVRAKISDAIRARLRQTPEARIAEEAPLTRGRGRRPDPLIANLAPRDRSVRAEPPLTAAQAQPERREPVLTAQRAAPPATERWEDRDSAHTRPPLRAERASFVAEEADADTEADFDAWAAGDTAPQETHAGAEAAPQPAIPRKSGAPRPATPAIPATRDDTDDGDDDGGNIYEDGYGAEQAPSPSPAQRPAIPVAQPKKVVQSAPPKPVERSKRAQEEAEPRLAFDEPETEFELPPLSLLMSPDRIQRHHLSDEALEENARMLESVLDDYGVKGEIVSVRPGPVVTMYELEPAPGLKASRVIGLADDIARSMSALSARVSTVPGRSVIGIELPNDNREMVSFREILSSREYGDGNAKLPLALGKDIGGDPLVANLAKMPHLLIAGTTGSGKSVAINTMILSLLYKLSPDELRLVMIDPKMLELSVYDGIPHLLSPVVTDPKKAVVALKWVVGEMEDRYRKMSKMGVRNIDGYNGRVDEALKKGEMFSRTVQTGFDDETGDPVFETEEIQPVKMPYIVVIVDEMADLMMVAGKEIEACIQRLAQMARASGIHLIMATQRPSVDVITGTIKANFPTRISFQVTSKIDSRTILGEMGAEQLLGMGDMLYMAGGAKITRCHGPFCSDEEVEEVVNHLKAFGPPDYVGGVVEGPEDEKASDIDAVLGLNTGGNTGGEDALYDQAVAIVIKDRKCSTSYIQRKLGIGYNKAARLVEQMEDEGVVSPANHVGKREILVPEQ